MFNQIQLGSWKEKKCRWCPVIIQCHQFSINGYCSEDCQNDYKDWIDLTFRNNRSYEVYKRKLERSRIQGEKLRRAKGIPLRNFKDGRNLLKINLY